MEKLTKILHDLDQGNIDTQQAKREIIKMFNRRDQKINSIGVDTGGMSKIVEELKANAQSELEQIGLTPRTNFKGDQTDHDLEKAESAVQYRDAITILSSERFVVKDWLTSEVHNYSTLLLAEEKFNEIKKQSLPHDCDVQLYLIIDEFNNVD